MNYTNADPQDVSWLCDLAANEADLVVDNDVFSSDYHACSIFHYMSIFGQRTRHYFDGTMMTSRCSTVGPCLTWTEHKKSTCKCPRHPKCMQVRSDGVVKHSKPICKLLAGLIRILLDFLLQLEFAKGGWRISTELESIHGLDGAMLGE